jgi:exopolysaccharide production protein ExoY
MDLVKMHIEKDASVATALRISVDERRKHGASEGSTSNSNHLYRDFGKRVFDLMVVLLAAPFVLLLMAILLPLIALDGANPFYLQERIGRDGRKYRMWKLRTMIQGADACLEAYLAANPQARIEWDRSQKLKYDPRITRIGRLLRASSMDELPQFFNVFVGEMSLVGPRPMMPNQQDIYPGQAYYQLRPGITGLWQVTDRNQSTFADRALYDAAYERNLSLGTDLRLLMATVRVVLQGTGY